MRDQEAPTQLPRSPATAGTHHPPATQPPPAAAASNGGGRSRLLHLAFLCLAASTAAAWFVEPFVAAAESRLPASAVAATVLLLAACFHLTVHVVHSFAAPCPPRPAATAAVKAAATIAVTVGVGVASCLHGACGAPHEYRTAYN
ncbi:uncharacterized protein LOC125509322 [Triticum urartu]|uniref:uncharacterized protein LOC119301568 n=1 Tax=Triticum dicoccoides TaxID=85692 RepID=UPI0018909FA1|nr:uncharacterized protein LOC119301568 [Triticum dicoccoides]XP_048530236.1 uncharacterized protein LOC125509322 [Triticum urartu]